MTIAIKVENAVAYLSIDRLGQKNAISGAMWREIGTAVNGLKKSAVRLLVIRGEGGIFSAGADLSELKELSDLVSAKTYWASIKRALDVVSSLEFPTIAVVESYCFGGGCLLAIACDLRYAKDDALFQIPVAKNGWILDDATIARLTALVGPSFAKEFLFLSARKSAQQAQSIGLVNDVFSAQHFEENLLAVVNSVLAVNANSVQQIKKQIDRFSLAHSNANANAESLAAEEKRIAERFLPDSSNDKKQNER